MPDAISPPARQKAAKVLSVEAARAAILKKVVPKGAAGVAALYTAKTSEADRAMYEAALQELGAAEEVFVDRRKAKPRYYAWATRPRVPAKEEVAEELASFAVKRFPLLMGPADAKKHFGKSTEKIALLPPALDLLVEQKRLVLLQLQSGKTRKPLYVSAEGLRAALGGESQPARPKSIPIAQAYAAVVERTGFPVVMLSELLRESSADLPALHRWALAEHRAGRAVLSFADWSLATPAQQAAVLEMGGDRYLQVRLLA